MLNQSPNPADIISFDIMFLETDIAQGMVIKKERTGLTYNFARNVEFG